MSKFFLVTPEPFIAEAPDNWDFDDLEDWLQNLAEHPSLGASGWDEVNSHHGKHYPTVDVRGDE